MAVSYGAVSGLPGDGAPRNRSRAVPVIVAGVVILSLATLAAMWRPRVLVTTSLVEVLNSGGVNVTVPTAGASCEEIRQAFFALNISHLLADGVYTLPTGPAFCDMFTAGGGWTYVWRNRGGFPPGDEVRDAKSNQQLRHSGMEAVVEPPWKGNSKPAINSALWRRYANTSQCEWIKIGSLYHRELNGGAPVWKEVKRQNVVVKFNDNKFADIFNASISRCIHVKTPFVVTINGKPAGKTTFFNHYASFSYGLASSDWGNNADRCGQEDANLITVPGDLLRLDIAQKHPLNAIRHLFSYVDNDFTAHDASRCQFACWSNGYSDYYDSFVWGVRC